MPRGLPRNLPRGVLPRGALPRDVPRHPAQVLSWAWPLGIAVACRGCRRPYRDVPQWLPQRLPWALPQQSFRGMSWHATAQPATSPRICPIGCTCWLGLRRENNSPLESAFTRAMMPAPPKLATEMPGMTPAPAEVSPPPGVMSLSSPPGAENPQTEDDKGPPDRISHGMARYATAVPTACHEKSLIKHPKSGLRQNPFAFYRGLVSSSGTDPVGE